MKDQFKADLGAELSDGEIKDAALRAIEQQKEVWLASYLSPMSTELLKELSLGEWNAK